MSEPQSAQSSIRSAPQALHVGYEKAGLVVHDQPIPWNAEAVLVEANLRLPHADMRRIDDYTIHRPDGDAIPAESIREEDAREQRWRVVFRIPRPSAATTVAVQWRGRELGRVELSLLSREQFLAGLRITMPTVFVRLGEESIACRTFVASQCRGLVASALLTGPTSLSPLSELDVSVLIGDEAGPPQRCRVHPTCSQLMGRQALFTVAPMKYPRKRGTWTVTWMVGEQELERREIKAVGSPRFQKSLRVGGTRYVLQDESGAVHLARSLPPEVGSYRVGPCFLIACGEPGMAGLCRLRVTARVSGASATPGTWDQDVLVTDGLALVAPGTLAPSELRQVHAFELSMNGKSLAVLALTPAPEASFTSEGGFKPPEAFAWTSAADAELDERLGRLLEERFRRN